MIASSCISFILMTVWHSSIWIYYNLFFTISVRWDCFQFLAVSSAVISEKAMAPRSSTLAWKIPWMEKPGRLQSMGSLRVGHD